MSVLSVYNPKLCVCVWGGGGGGGINVVIFGIVLYIVYSLRSCHI